MSGYFVVTRAYLDEVAESLSGTGFKILLDLVVSARRPVRLAEIPYRFRPRLHGQSKLDIVVAVKYLGLVADKLVGDFVPPSYVIFACAGSVGILAHLAAIQLFRLIPGTTLERAQLASSVIVIAINFLLNNQFTFRSARLRGKQLFLGGLIFYVACSIGLFLNLRVFEAVTGISGPGTWPRLSAWQWDRYGTIGSAPCSSGRCGGGDDARRRAINCYDKREDRTSGHEPAESADFGHHGTGRIVPGGAVVEEGLRGARDYPARRFFKTAASALTADSPLMCVTIYPALWRICSKAFISCTSIVLHGSAAG